MGGKFHQNEKGYLFILQITVFDLKSAHAVIDTPSSFQVLNAMSPDLPPIRW